HRGSGPLPPLSAALGEAHGFFRGADQSAGLVLALLVFALRHRIRDDAGAGLDVHDAVLHDGGAEHDAGVHGAVGGEVADGAAVDAAALGLQLLDDLHRPNLGRAGDGAGGKAGHQRAHGVVLRIDLAIDVGDDVHDVGVVLDDVALGDLDRADARHAAHIVAP